MATTTATQQKEEPIELYPYEFTVESIPNEHRPMIGVIRLDNRDLDKSDIERVEGILKDLGNWENLKQAGSILLGELGYESATKVSEILDHSSTQYSFHPDHKNGEYYELLRFWVNLESDERKRREEKKLGSYPTVKEIASKLRNVPKWRSVLQTIEMIRNSSGIRPLKKE